MRAVFINGAKSVILNTGALAGLFRRFLMSSALKKIKCGYQVGALRIEPGLVLAPMSGVTCKAFRRLIKELNRDNVGLLVREFISVEALTRHVPRAVEQMRFEEMERPLGIQIFGYDVSRMRDAALMAQDAGADLVDINCGCPAPKVVRKGGGCELMRQPEQREPSKATA